MNNPISAEIAEFFYRLPGVRMSEAHHHFCDQEILAPYLEARRNPGSRIRIVKASMGANRGYPVGPRPWSQLKSTWRTIENTLCNKLLAGDPIAIGFPCDNTGHRSGAKPGIIPYDVLDARDRRLDWSGERIEGAGLKFVDVRLVSRETLSGGAFQSFLAPDGWAHTGAESDPELSATEPPEFSRIHSDSKDRQTNTVAGQKRCEDWLRKYATDYVAGGLNHVPRSQLRHEGIKKFDISGKAFDRAWDTVTAQFPDLSRPGVRAKSN